MWCESIIFPANIKVNEILAVKCLMDFHHLQPHLIEFYFIKSLMARHHSQDNCICALTHSVLLEILMDRHFFWVITRVEVKFS